MSKKKDFIKGMMFKVRARDNDDSQVTMCCAKGCGKEATNVNEFTMPFCKEHYEMTEPKFKQMKKEAEAKGFKF